jgi:hypothetical protein
MADWPDLAMLKQVLGVDRSDKDDLLQQALAASIEVVVAKCGGDPVEVTFGSPPDGVPSVTLVDPSPDDDRVPIEITVNHRIAQATVQLATRAFKGPDAPFGVASTFDTGGIYVARYDPIFDQMLFGNRQRFSVS